MPLALVSATVAVAGSAALARQELHPTLGSSPARVVLPVGETVTIILVAAVATLPLVTLLTFLSRRPPPGEHLASSLSSRLSQLDLTSRLSSLRQLSVSSRLTLPSRLGLLGRHPRALRASLGVGVLLLLVLGGLALGGSARTMITVVIPLVVGFAVYGFVLERLVRWLDGRIPPRGRLR